MKNRFSSRNLLFRWVSRHARATTLFRFSQLPDQRRAHFEQGSDIEPSSRTIIQAYLIPQPERMQYSPDIMSEGTQQKTEEKHVAPAVQPPAPATPLKVPSPLQRNEQAKDPIWRRLQNIMHRHQEAESAQPPEASQEIRPSLIPLSGEKPIAPDRSDKAPSIPERMQAPEITGLQKKQAAEPSLRTTALMEEGESSSIIGYKPSERSSAMGPEPEVEHNGNDATEYRSRPIDARMPTPEQTSSPVSVQRKMDHRQKVDRSTPHGPPPASPKYETGSPGDQKEVADQISPTGRSSHPPDGEREIIFPPQEEQVEPGEALPLESVWPVQTIPAFPFIQKTPSKGRTEERLPDTEEVEALQASRHGVETILKAIAPADQTASRVEVITPRRLPPVQMQRANGLSSKKPAVLEEKVNQESIETTRPGPIVQEEESLGEVPTEIGPLPADLWELIDEPVPEGRRTLSEENVPESDLVEEIQPRLKPFQEPARSAPTFHENPPTAKVFSSVQPRPSIIQRQEASPAEAVPAASTPAASPASENQIEELARRIYNEVRKKIRIDWERFRNS